MKQLENFQARYRSNTRMGRTRIDGPDEFEPSKFDCIFWLRNKKIKFALCTLNLSPASVILPHNSRPNFP